MLTGAHVVVSDRESVLPLLQYNVAKNVEEGVHKIVVCELDWFVTKASLGAL